jgi:hypothetical protein
MAFTVYPVGADSGFSAESAISSERDRLVAALGGRMATFVVDPFAGGDFSLTTSTSSFDVDVAAGTAFVGGHYVESNSTVTVTVNASVTSEIFLVVDDAEPDDASIIAQDSGTSDPTGQYVVKLHEVTSDGSGVTGTTDFRPFVPYRQDAPVNAVTGQQQATVTGQAIDSTGVFTTSVSFPHGYQTAADAVEVWLDSVTDTSVEFGFMNATNVTASGFDLQYSVVTAAAGGATADFGYTANGE